METLTTIFLNEMEGTTSFLPKMIVYARCFCKAYDKFKIENILKFFADILSKKCYRKAKKCAKVLYYILEFLITGQLFENPLHYIFLKFKLELPTRNRGS